MTAVDLAHASHEERIASVENLLRVIAAEAVRSYGSSVLTFDEAFAFAQEGAWKASLSWKPDGGRAFSTWAYAYARRYVHAGVMRDSGRGSKGQRPSTLSIDRPLRGSDEDFASDVPDPRALGGDRHATILGVRQAVEALPPREREAVVLTYWLDLPPTEVARRMGYASHSGVRMALRSAYAKLRESLAA